MSYGGYGNNYNSNYNSSNYGCSNYGGGGDRYNQGYNQYGGFGGYHQSGFQQRGNFQRYEELDPEDEQFRKLFVGGLNLETTVDSLKAYFEKIGTITDAVVMKDPNKKISRCFGFITFKLAANVDHTQCSRPHVIDGKRVDTRRAMRKEDANNPDAKANTCKIFVGGIHKETSDDNMKSVCEMFGGEVEKVDIIKDRMTGEGRGFAFVTFKDCDHVDKIFLKRYIKVNGKTAEVKKAVERDGQRGDGGGGNIYMGRGGMQGNYTSRGGRGGQSGYGGYNGGRGGNSGYGGGYGSGYGGQQYGGYSGYSGGGGGGGGGGYSSGSGYDTGYGYGNSYNGVPPRGSGSYSNNHTGGYGQSNYGGSYR